MTKVRRHHLIYVAAAAWITFLALWIYFNER